MLVAQGLHKTFKIKEGKPFRKKKTRIVQAVKGVDISIKEGTIVGLLGINGAGKTTTIKMLSALLEPSGGSIEMDGIDVIRHHMKAKEKINIITGGERNLYWRLTAVENLEYFGSLYSVKKDILKARIASVLHTVGLEEYKDVTVEKYSKGMKQRLQIARGLINDPKYIFLDEPTLGLDIIIAKELRSYIKKLATEEGKGILLTTHYIAEAEELCDYIYVIHDGTIVSEGSVDKIKTLQVAYKKDSNLEEALYELLSGTKAGKGEEE